MIFQKKIIIGSIMSFVATAVGVIAVFFPDLFNMQKKKMETLSLEIRNSKDFEVLDNFLQERMKDKKIFSLNVDLCDGEQLANEKIYFFDNNDKDAMDFVTSDLIFIDSNENDEAKKRVALTKVYPDMLDEGFAEWCGTDISRCPGKKYYFPYKAYNYIYGVRNSNSFNQQCVWGMSDNIRIKGFFMFPDDESSYQQNQMIEDIFFEKISEKDVMLKDY